MNKHSETSKTVPNPGMGRVPISADGLASLASVLGHPDDVLNHPELTRAEKRAVLASWASDIRAVENAPALRQLDSGAVVNIDDVLQAMEALDTAESSPADRAMRVPGCRLSFARQLEKLASWLPSRIAQKSGRDDDDDPPPCPAAAAVPVRKVSVVAFGGRPEGLPV